MIKVIYPTIRNITTVDGINIDRKIAFESVISSNIGMYFVKTLTLEF